VVLGTDARAELGESPEAWRELFEVDFYTPTFSWDRIHLLDTPGRAHSIQRERTIVRAGADALRFEIRPGEQWLKGEGRLGHGSHRTEVHDVYRARMGQEYWYGFSIYIPTSLAVRDTRLVIGQWHGQRDTRFDEHPRSPLLVQRYRDGRFYIQVRWSAILVQTTETVDLPNAKRTLYEDRAFPRDRWVDFVYHVKWSFLDDGFVRVWRDGIQIVHYDGPVGYNDREGPYFRFGLYRDDFDSTDVMYWDEYRRGTSYESVDPSANVAGRGHAMESLGAPTQ
jgi:hypothetical protein